MDLLFLSELTRRRGGNISPTGDRSRIRKTFRRMTCWLSSMMVRIPSLLFTFSLTSRAVAQLTILSGTAAASTTNLGDSLPTGSEAIYANSGSTITVPSTTSSSEDASSLETMTGTFSTMAATNSTTLTNTRSSSSTSRNPDVWLYVDRHGA